jgi:hypothetical protein
MSLAPEGQTGPLSPPEANARRTPDEPPIPLAVAERLVPLPPSRIEPAVGEEANAAPLPEPPAESGPRLDPGPPVPSPFAIRLDRVPELVTVDRPEDEPAPEVDVLTLIRREIKQRLPYFQGCAQAAQRRNGMEVRRLQATWAIAADGSIKDMKLDGVADTQLAACIVRVGSRPFMVQPGLELVVPTPIVFVR